jgi:hypothetical protein
MQLAGIGVLAGALTIVGAVGPWATGVVLRGGSAAGTDANRGVTVSVAAGIALLLLLLAGLKNLRWAAMLAAVAGLISFGLTVWSFAAINKFANADARLSIGRGWGIWLSLIGSIVLVVTAFLAALVREPDAVVEAPTETTTTT